jgi:hypothetical protein
MRRLSWVAFVVLLAVLPVPAADEQPLTGKWKVILGGPNGQTGWLVSFENKDGKWTGKIDDTIKDRRGLQIFSSLENVALEKDVFTFELSTGRESLRFNGKLPKGSAKKIFGTLEQGKDILPVVLEATEITTFADLPKEILANAQPGDAEVAEAALVLLKEATERKAKPEDVRGWAEKAFKCSEPYGPHWQRQVALRCAEALLDQKGFETQALENARRVERLVDEKDELDLQVRTYSLMVRAVKAAGKTDNLKEYQTKLAKLEAQVETDYVKKMIDFAPDPFKGRKEKSDRAVLVELFTGAECQPCVGPDLAFEVLGKTFKPTEVILLQYHLHAPSWDGLANAATESRAGMYAVEGTPTIFFNGKDAEAAAGGSDKSKAKKKYEDYRGVVEPLLEKPALAKIKASATLKDGKVDITAEVSDLDQTGDKIRLRLALVEEKVRYDGSNGIKFHHHVVRDFPGGIDGLPLKEKTGKQSVTVDLDDLRKQNNKYLDTVGADVPSRPMDFKNLYVVAFVQNDKTKDILQATQVEVQEK